MTQASDRGIVDVAVVGAGPAGLAAALYTARAGLDTVLFGDPYKGQLARAGTIENYLTWPEPVDGVQLVEKMVAHVERWGATLDDSEIRQILRTEDCFQLITQGGSALCAYAVVLATGTQYKTLGVSGEEEYYGRGVGYCTICDGPLYRERPVAVVGHGDGAALAALRMSAIASRVYLVANRARLGADPALGEQLAGTEHLSLYEGMKPLAIVGDGEQVQAFRFRPLRGGDEVEEIPVDAVFVEVGTLPATAIAADLDLRMAGEFIWVDREQRTSVPGIFAAGDLTGGEAKQAAVSVGDGTKAAIATINHIKRLGVSAEKSKIKSVQWGAASRQPAGHARGKEEQTREPMRTTDRADGLIDYIASDAGFQRVYDRYEPDEELVAEIADLQPEAHVVIISATWCPDCRRNVPRWARITEALPGWRHELHPREDEARTRRLNIRAIPTFIIYDRVDGEELGRIVENPTHGSLEQDILHIVRAARKKTA